jgi:hypothetical protein
MNSASLCSLAGRYDNPIPTWFLAPTDCLKNPAQISFINAQSWAYIQRRDSIFDMVRNFICAWRIDPIAEVKLLISPFLR